MNKERLTRLAELLENLPQEFPDKKPKFDLEKWACGGYEPRCNTTACAVGWAAMHPWFRERGLRLYRGTDGGWTPNVGWAPKYHERDGWGAVTEFFDISSLTADFLFSAESYEDQSRQSVARRIRKFIKDHEREAAA